MKRILQIALILLAFSIVSCESFLDVTPKQSLDADQAIQTEQDLRNAINGCYDVFQNLNYGRYALLIFLELASDNAHNTGTIIEYGPVNNNNVLENNPVITSLWRTIYNGINRVNTALYYLDKLGLDDDKAQAYGAELRFIRAWHYYHLALIFKDVPLRTEPTLGLANINMPASPQADILDFVKTELEFAKDRITQTSPKRANKSAAKALLARLHLFLDNHTQAIEYSTDVINNSGRMLADSYEALFTPDVSVESIFEIDYTAQDENRLAQYFFPSSLAGRYEVAPTEGFIDAFADNDARRAVTIDDSGANPYCIKYSDIASGTDNVYLFRLAEMYLIRAEAKALSNGDISEILSDINMIRNRAMLEDASTDNHNDLLLIIENERRFEFAFEGHRWFDLIRTGRAIDLLETVTSTDQFYFPIPLSETTTNEDL